MLNSFKIDWLESHASNVCRIILMCGLTFIGYQAPASTKYWDTAAGAGNGVGGTGTWTDQTTALFSTTVTGDASLTSAATSDNVIFAGTAGTVSLGTSSGSQMLQAASFEVSASGYTLKSLTTSTLTLAGNITLDNNVTLTLATPASGAMTINSVSGGTSSSVNLGGSVAASGDAIRINLASGAIIAASAPIVIATSGNNGVAGFVSSSATATINATITNNTSVTTALGATSGNILNVNAAINGSAGLQFSVGASGGTGTTNLNAASTYNGNTIFNSGTSAVIKLGVDNALPTTTDVTMAATSGNGGILDLNGHNQEIASLTSGAGGGSITNGASGSGTNTLTISGATTPAAFNLVISDGATRKTALTRAGTGTTTLGSANTYSGTTTISGGTLNAAATSGSALGGTGGILISSGGTLLLGAANQINDSATMNLNGGTFNLGGKSEGAAGTNGLGVLTLSANSTLDFGTTAGSSTVQFGGITQSVDNTILQITNWQGTPGTGGGSDRLLFAGTVSDFTSQFRQDEVSFNGVSGYSAIQSTGYYEITAVPEPTTIIGAGMFLCLIGWRERRRILDALRYMSADR